MNQVRILYMILVLSLAGMGTWVWKVKQNEESAKMAVVKVEQEKRTELALRDKERQEALAAQNEENQKVVQKINDDWEKKIDSMRAEERKRVAAAFEQFSDILDGNKKTIEYINALETKVKAGKSINKNEAEKLAVVATGLAYLQKQYQKPFEKFGELETYLAQRANANVESPNMRWAFWKRIFNSEFREKERDFYRTEGERKGFQDASDKFNTAYASAQKQMASVNLDFEKSIVKLNDFVAEKKKDAPDLSEFFNQARKALNTHQKVLDFQPDVTKPTVEAPKP